MTFSRIKLGQEDQKVAQTPATKLPRHTGRIWIFGIGSIFIIFTLFLQVLLQFNITNILPKTDGFSFPFLQKNQEKLPDLNILLIGVGGGNHEGPDLTDTLQVAHIKRNEKKIVLFSIPRDLWVKTDGGIQSRINDIYNRSFRISGNRETAINDLTTTISGIIGSPIDGYIKIDFNGFIKLVDALDGIEIDIPESIRDTTYPDSNYGYETFSIQKGLQKLDGKTALKYARSRHSTSDFSRSSRQQLILSAIKEAALKKELLTNPKDLIELFALIQDNFNSDVSMSNIIDLALSFKDIQKDSIYSVHLHDGCSAGISYCTAGGFLYAPDRSNFGGAAILLPEGASAGNVDNYTKIRRFTTTIFHTPDFLKAPDTIRIINGSRRSGLAAKAAMDLLPYGFSLPEKGSILSDKEYTGSGEIQYLSGGTTPSTLESLKMLYPMLPQVPKDLLSTGSTASVEIIITKDLATYEAP